jgi:hypothetical protein
VASAAPDAAASATLQDVAQRLAQGASVNQIVESMVSQGFTQEDAAGIVGHVNVQFRQAMAGSGLRRIRAGALWAVGGTAVTVLTYMQASAGGTYFVAWGAVIFGVYDMIRGLIVWLKYRA